MNDFLYTKRRGAVRSVHYTRADELVGELRMIGDVIPMREKHLADPPKRRDPSGQTGVISR
jgi:hypothetical protein